jgi:putative hemolysin
VTSQPGDPQKIFGYVNFKDIVACLRLSPHEPSLRAVVRPLPTFPGQTSVASCLEHLMREHTHIALVRDADEVVGMITMEDIIEELVGEIADEFDRLPSHITPVGAGWIVGGSASLAQLRDITGVAFAPPSDTPPATLNDWIVQRLARPPQGGDQLAVDSLDILVRKVRRHSVQEAHLIPKPAGLGKAQTS